MIRRTFYLSKIIARNFNRSSAILNQISPKTPLNPNETHKTAKTLAEVTGQDFSLIGQGGEKGKIPTDMDQATGMERLEILALKEGIDFFDMEEPITEGSGTYKDPFIVPTYVGYRFVGCQGKDRDEHKAYWMKVEDNQISRCWHCGKAFKARFLGNSAYVDDH